MVGDMEMDRGVQPSRAALQKKTAVADYELNIPSLEEKLKDHLELRGGHHALLPDLIARMAIPLYLVTLAVACYLGLFVVMPQLYGASADPTPLLYHRLFIGLIIVELLANWLCIRYVDCSYLGFLRKRWQKGGAPSSHGHCAETGLLNGSHSNGFAASPSAYQPRASPGSQPWKPAFRPPQQTAFPYWSWVPCYVCEVMRPPRCHHCPLCQTCVLKRDHHCFFAGRCVGWRNQRHFLVFIIWTFLACGYGTLNFLQFFASELWHDMSWADVLAPVAVVRWLLGYVSGMTAACVTVQTMLVYFMLLSAGLMQEHVTLLWRGKTMFEMSGLKSTVELRDSRPLPAKLRAALGSHWLLNLLLPLHWLTDVQEDPENWPSIKVYRH